MTKDKTMKCETLQFNIPLLSDDALTDTERAELHFHLAQCPVCRSKHTEFINLKNNLRNLSRPEMPADLLNSVRNAVRNESKQVSIKSTNIFSESVWEWMQYRLMPYSVGTAISLFLVISLLYTLNAARNGANLMTQEIASNNAKSSIRLNSNTPNPTSDELVFTEESYAALRVPVSMDSPSLNPKGALLALTSSVVRGNMKDEEVTLVADVFSSGLAQIAQVVEAPRNNESLNKIENAFENKQGNAPFVPANLDKRSNDMRVVFKIIWVDVDEKKAEIKKSSKK